MNWSTEENLRDQVLRLWERGDLLRARLSLVNDCDVENATHFPLRLRLKSPDSGELSDHFDEVRIWITQLTAIQHLQIEWRDLKHRVLGKQQLPHAIYIHSISDALAFIAKLGDDKRFSSIVASTKTTQPALLTWLEKRPLEAVALHREWEQLLAVVGWMKQHPQPAIYLRQLDIAGIHSKFIEAHKKVLTELFDLTLPSSKINHAYSGVSQFEARYGFLNKPLRIRFRILDTDLHLIADTQGADITLDAKNFATLALTGTHVFITENETNFLAFPRVKNAIVVFGAGYGWDAFACADWLQHCEIHYWGDIDTHGFAILNQLRHHFPHVRSLLMDSTTLMEHQHLWGKEEKQVLYSLDLLSPEEAKVFSCLQQNSLQANLRLEQEHIGFSYLMWEMTKITDAPSKSKHADNLCRDPNH